MGEAAETIVRRASWSTDRIAIRSVRHTVFVLGQNVPASLETDGLDPHCLHVLAIRPASMSADSLPLGTGRLNPETGKIGRVAVLETHRHLGVGTRLVRELIACARQCHLETVHLHAQVHSIEFYQALGFIPHGAQFQEAGIDHLNMRLNLNKS